jgi:cytochrome c oxidase subunit 4
MLGYVPMGRLNAIVAIGIACLKASLVALWFMHLRRPVPLLRLAASASLLWLFFMVTLTLTDVLAR